MNPNRFFKIAANVATKIDDQRDHRIGCVGVRSDGATTTARNGSVKESSSKHLLTCKKTGKRRFPKAHAEVRLSKKLDVGSVVFLCRVGGKGNWLLSKPCQNCLRVLRNKGTKRVYFTISNSEYGVITL